MANVPSMADLEIFTGPTGKCRCGHTGGGAGGMHRESEESGASGHGPCLVEGCACQKFRWVNWTPEYKKALRAWRKKKELAPRKREGNRQKTGTSRKLEDRLKRHVGEEKGFLVQYESDNDTWSVRTGAWTNSGFLIDDDGGIGFTIHAAFLDLDIKLREKK